MQKILLFVLLCFGFTRASTFLFTCQDKEVFSFHRLMLNFNSECACGPFVEYSNVVNVLGISLFHL